MPAEEKVSTKSAQTQMPIELKRGPRPTGWGAQQQMAEDLHTRQEEWDRREAKLLDKGKIAAIRPFPGLNPNVR